MTWRITLIGVGLACMPLAASTTVAPVTNRPHSSPRSFTLVGTPTCAAWTGDIPSNAKHSHDLGINIGRLADTAWLAGYISGINTAAHAAGDLFLDLNLETATDWVDVYCSTHKDSDAAEAANAMLAKLNRQF